MKHTIACRIASYGEYQDRGWSHLPEIGIHNVEIPAPALDDLSATKKKLREHNLKATSLQGKCDINSDESVAAMDDQLKACNELGAKICFLSVKVGEDGDRKAAYNRLKKLGDLAANHGVVVALETHPDMVTNGSVAAETMKNVQHPNVLINFDTANVYYYNHDVTAEGELEKCIDFIGAVHIKDTNGGFKEWHFCELGNGVVDFPKVFSMLDKKGYKGPYTMELEGVRGVEYTEESRCKYIADSVEYLRSIDA